MKPPQASTETESEEPALVLRRCRPWLEKHGPSPVESDTQNISRRGRKAKGRRIGDRPKQDYVPNTLVPFGRVVMVGYLAWETYRRISAWFAHRRSKELALVEGGDRQLAAAEQSQGQLLAEPDPRTGMILQRLSGKAGFPTWARQPVQPDRLEAAVRQQYRPPERASRQRRMVMIPRTGLPPPEVWLEQQQAEEERVEGRRVKRPAAKKATVPHRRMTLVERAARGVGTRFDEEPQRGVAAAGNLAQGAAAPAAPAKKLSQRRKELQQRIQGGEQQQQQGLSRGPERREPVLSAA